MLLVCISLVVQAQQAEKQASPRYTVIPPTDVLLTIASQPDCPVQIENPRLLYNHSTKRFSYQFDLRNRGSKAITGFSLDEWVTGGTGGSIIYEWEEPGRILMPGQVTAQLNIDEKQFVPMSQEVREKLKLKGEMRMLIVLVVRYVHFTGGFTYEGLKASDAAQKYLEKFNCADEEP